MPAQYGRRRTDSPLEVHLANSERESDFISVVSHELRTPLTAVSGFLSMLLHQDFGELNDRQIHYLDRAYQASRRTLELVDDLVNVSAIDSGRLNLQVRPLVIESIMSDVFFSIAQTTTENNVSIQVKRRQNLPMVL